MGPKSGICSYNSANVNVCTFPPHSTGEIHYANTSFSDVLSAINNGLENLNRGIPGPGAKVAWPKMGVPEDSHIKI